MAAPESIMAGEEAQDQVILPTSIAFGICLRGIKARLGRSVVTLFGVGLGIAFLMAVLSSFHIQRAMRAEAQIARDIDRRVAVVRGEVGMLKAKKFLVVLGEGSAQDAGFVQELLAREAAVSAVTAGALPEGTVAAALPQAAEEADAAVCLGDYESLLSDEWLLALKGKRVLVFEEPKAKSQFESAGATLKKLGIELRPDEIERAKKRQEQTLFRMYWIVAVSLLITVGGITNAMLMSVTERFREIGTMKCLGALSTFVVKLFLIESSLIGLVGSFLGCVAGVGFSLLAYSYTFQFVKVFAAVSFVTLTTYGVACLAAGVALAVVAGIYPARVAAKMVPASALSSHV